MVPVRGFRWFTSQIWSAVLNNTKIKIFYSTSYQYQCCGSMTVLVWIRIRGSIPLTNLSRFESGSCYFRHWPSRYLQKTNFLKTFFLFLLFFLLFLLDDRSVSGSIPLTIGSGFGSRRPKNIRIRRIRIRKTDYHIGKWCNWLQASYFRYLYSSKCCNRMRADNL